MVQHHNLCIVVADGGHARFVRQAADFGLHTEEAFDSPSMHKQSSDLGSDRPGRSFESASATRHAVQPRHDPHELEKQKFARVVAGRINAEADAGTFNELILAAPPHVLSELQEELNGNARAKLRGTLAKDLVKTPDHELQPHFSQWVRPVHRA